MQPKYIVRTTLDRAACRALARHQTRKLRFYFLFVDLALAACVAMLWVRGSAFAGLATVVLFILLLYTLFMDRFAGMLMLQAADPSAGETEYRFHDDWAEASNKAGTTRLRYAGFLGIHEAPEHYFLYVQKKVAIILPKADFAEGDPRAFGLFAAEKMGRPLLRTRS